MSSGSATLFNGSGAPPPGLAKSTRYPHLVNNTRPQGPSLSDSPVDDSPELLAKIEAAVIEYLTKRHAQTDTLAKLGIYLRGRNLLPQEGLKKFITNRPQLFAHLDDGKGGNRARLLTSPSYFNNGNGASSVNGFHETNNHYGLLTPPGIDEQQLERQVVSYIYEHGTRENPVTVPELGEYCKKHLGFSMKGYLTRFLITRRQMFCLPDDGRQHVVLQPGAAEALGVVGSLPHLPEDLLGGSVNGDHGEMPLEVQHQRPIEYGKWDRITQEMYDLAVSRGGSVPYKEVDAYIKARCAAEIAASGISLEHWQAQKHSWKRRNLFKKEGNCLVLHAGIAPFLNGNGKRGAGIERGGERGNHNSSTSISHSHSNNNTASAGIGFSGGGIGGGGGGNGIMNGEEHEEAFPTLNISHESPNTTLQAFISERKALENLHQEVQRNLASMAAVSELEKENQGLRAACVTLGRELLAVKDEILDLRMQLAEHGINISSTSGILNSPASGDGLLDEIFLPADLL